MTPTLMALALYASWTLFLLLLIVGQRTWLTLTGIRAANEFGIDGADISPASQRLCRAHANCVEHFPIVAGLLVVATLADLSSVTDDLALLVFGARVLQSVVHLVSTSAVAVTIRFGFFLVQLGVEGWWAYRLLLG